MQQRKHSKASSPSFTMAADSLSFMLERELAVHSCRAYVEATNLDACNYSPRSPGDRTAMVDWCYDIVDKCRFARETVALAFNIVDRFMSSLSLSGSRGNPQDNQGCLVQDADNALYSRRQYQLAALTALYMSIKINERVAFISQDFSAAICGMYTAEEIEDTEHKMLHALEWRLCSTALQVGCKVLDLMKERMGARQGTLHFLREELYFQTEIAVREYYFATQRPSTIAIASLLNSIEEVNATDCELLLNALARILREFRFKGTSEMLEVKDKLKGLLAKHEAAIDRDVDASVFEEGTRGLI